MSLRTAAIKPSGTQRSDSGPGRSIADPFRISTRRYEGAGTFGGAAQPARTSSLISTGFRRDYAQIPAFTDLSRPGIQFKPWVGVLQAKLSIGDVNDPLEHEADRVADKVMRMPAPDAVASSAPPQVSRKCEKCVDDEEKLQKKKAGPQATAGEAPASVHEALRSPGQPLDRESRAFFEPRFGKDFSHVRIHADTRAAESAHSVHARAYTVGQHVAFGRGQYSTRTAIGRLLLAHELAHVVQQTGPAGQSGPVNSRSQQAVARAPSNDVDEAAKELQAGARNRPPLTPEDMWEFLIATRASEEAIPVSLLPETKARLDALEAKIKTNPTPDLRKEYRTLLNRYNISQLGTKGGSAGKGYNTIAMVEIVDANGAPVENGVAYGVFEGDEHAEEIAIAKLRKQLGDRKVPGGRIVVTGDQVVCKEVCKPALKKFAVELEADQVEGHVFTREKIVGKGQASAKTTARTATRASSLGKPLSHEPPEVIYKRPTGGEPASGSSGGTTNRPLVSGEPVSGSSGGTTNQPRVSGEPASGSSGGTTNRPRVSGEPGDDVRARASAAIVETEAGRKGSWFETTMASAQAVTTVILAIDTIQGSVDQIAEAQSRAESGALAPQIAAAIQLIEKDFPPLDELKWKYKFDLDQKKYDAAAQWLDAKADLALANKGANLDTMWEQLAAVYWYHDDCDTLARRIGEHPSLGPMLSALQLRTTALYKVIRNLEGAIPHAPSDVAQLTYWGVRTSFWNAVQELNQLESYVSTRKWEYEHGLEETLVRLRSSAQIYNLWARRLYEIDPKRAPRWFISNIRATPTRFSPA